MTDEEFGERMSAVLDRASICAKMQTAAEMALTWPWHRRARRELDRFAEAVHAERSEVAALISELRKGRYGD